jgi:hypothetical protein
MNPKKPLFLCGKPLPQLKQRLYNGRKMLMWEGKVKISDVKGWVDNPRIELGKKSLMEKLGNRELSQDEIFELMKNDSEMRLKELRDDILKNGLREALTLSYQGKLLDGNRRFFAVKYALESMSSGDINRQDLEIVDAFVLSEDATDEDEQNVLVEENFSPSLKIEWPDYVKARRVIKADESGLSVEEIASKYNWPRSKIRETLKIHEILSDFEAFAVAEKDPNDESGGGLGYTEQESQVIAAKNYQFFNEAQKSFYNQLRTEVDFKIQFFKWIHEKKFSSFPEVRIAYRAWKDPEAKAAIMQKEPAAAKSAKAILDYNDRIVRSSDEAIGRIDSFVKFLKGMTAEEIKLIPKKSREDLKQVLSLVIKMSQAASKE